MSKSTAPVVAATTAALKVPTVVANEIAAVEYAMDSNVMRSRPVVAINELGELVVCCKTTAKKHGWEVQGKLYVRTRSSTSKKAEAAPVVPAALTKLAADKHLVVKADTRKGERRAPAKKSLKATILANEVADLLK